MKTEAEQVFQMNAAPVWAEEGTVAHSKEKARGWHWLFLVAALGMSGVVGVSVWIYVSGLRTLSGMVAQNGDNGGLMMLKAREWGVEMLVAAAGGGVLLGLVAILGGRSLRQNWFEKQRKAQEATDLRTQKLLGQVAEATVSAEEAKRSEVEMQTRLIALSENQAVLENELNERRQAEKSLAQQAQQLERSKDMLEMHIQTRTKELQKLQRRNELILNSAGEGICGFDLQGKITFANPASGKLTGWQLEQMIGRSEKEIFFAVSPAGGGSAGLVKNEKGEFLAEQSFYRRDGTAFPVEYVRSPINENGKVVGSVVMFKDITERRLSEDRLSRKAEELARSNAELEQFAFVASHDLQEPLRKIQAFGDRLKLKCDQAQMAEGRDYLDRMQSAAARMQTLINDLLTFSRIIRSSQPFTVVNLEEVTKEVLGDLEHRIEKTGAKVTVGKLPKIEADPLQMRQLLQNLIGNALKFQAAGAVPVVKIDAQLVTRDQIREDAVFKNAPATVKPDDKFCALTVEDNGIGFEEQYLEKIFAVFQRLHGRSEYEGTGVGLAVCRRITDRHGGLITAQSKPGEGSTFVVILPLSQPKEKEDK